MANLMRSTGGDMATVRVSPEGIAAVEIMSVITTAAGAGATVMVIPATVSRIMMEIPVGRRRIEP